jgi:hypothetical protein
MQLTYVLTMTYQVDAGNSITFNSREALLCRARMEHNGLQRDDPQQTRRAFPHRKQRDRGTFYSHCDEGRDTNRLVTTALSLYVLLGLPYVQYVRRDLP